MWGIVKVLPITYVGLHWELCKCTTRSLGNFEDGSVKVITIQVFETQDIPWCSMIFAKNIWMPPFRRPNNPFRLPSIVHGPGRHWTNAPWQRDNPWDLRFFGNKQTQADSSRLTWPDHTASLLTQAHFHLNHLTGLGLHSARYTPRHICLLESHKAPPRMWCVSSPLVGIKQRHVW